MASEQKDELPEIRGRGMRVNHQLRALSWSSSPEVLDPPGMKDVISCGPREDRLDGERCKLVKYVWRFVTKDGIILELEHFSSGESSKSPVEMVCNRNLQERYSWPGSRSRSIS